MAAPVVPVQPNEMEEELTPVTAKPVGVAGGGVMLIGPAGAEVPPAFVAVNS